MDSGWILMPSQPQIPEIGSILMGIPFLNRLDVASDVHFIHILWTLHNNNIVS